MLPREEQQYNECLQRINRSIEQLIEENAMVQDILAKSRYRKQDDSIHRQTTSVYKDIHSLTMDLYKFKENRYRLEQLLSSE